MFRLYNFSCFYLVWLFFCNWFYSSLEKVFGIMGEFISNCFFMVIVFVVVFVGICLVGFLWLKFEGRVVKFFVF